MLYNNAVLSKTVQAKIKNPELTQNSIAHAVISVSISTEVTIKWMGISAKKLSFHMQKAMRIPSFGAQENFFFFFFTFVSHIPILISKERKMCNL